MNQYFRMSAWITLNLGLAISLSACKGTVIGTAVEGAIAPQTISTMKDPTNPQSLVLPSDFSSDIPIYPQATLQSIEVGSGTLAASQNIFARWTSADDVTKVSSFYEDAFATQEWKVILRSPDGNFVIQKSDLLVTLSIQKSIQNLNQKLSQPDSTSIFLQYLRDRQINQALLNIDKNITVNPTQPVAPSINPINLNPINPLPNLAPTKNFSDVATIPEALRSPIIDLKNLGTISSKQENQFKPNSLIQRREYARWLVNTNNKLYANRPTRQIRLADPNSSSAFIDIPPSDPDFAVIQALVNAGLIPADPNPSNSSRRFRANEPVSREVLLQWKIPLDLRSALPIANLEAVKQAWGFQDSDRINPINFKFVLADYKLGDLSNIRRSFGYTTLFQPKKYVTRAEAAATLWYFGTPEDGVSAQNALQQNILQNNTLEKITPEPTPNKQPDPVPFKGIELPKLNPNPLNPVKPNN